MDSLNMQVEVPEVAPNPDPKVHCLECDNVYRESEELFIGWCPHCDNDDAHKTVYIEE